MGGSWGSGPPPPSFWGTSKLHMREKTARAYPQKRQVLLLNSYRDPPPPFPKSCIRPEYAPNTPRICPEYDKSWGWLQNGKIAGNFLRSPMNMILWINFKLQCQNHLLWPPPSSAWLKLFLHPPPPPRLFVGVKLHLPPLPLPPAVL